MGLWPIARLRRRFFPCAPDETKAARPCFINAFRGIFGRSERIRTSDPLLPKQVRYQTALRSDRLGGLNRLQRFGKAPLRQSRLIAGPFEALQPTGNPRLRCRVHPRSVFQHRTVLADRRRAFTQNNVDS